MSYCPILHQFVESFADLDKVGSKGATGLVQFGQEVWVRVMVEHVVDATVGFRGEVVVDQLEQQVPAAGQKFFHNCLVKGKVHLDQLGDTFMLKKKKKLCQNMINIQYTEMQTHVLWTNLGLCQDILE